jgi:DNA-binding transcriptional ArsR family regulator
MGEKNKQSREHVLRGPLQEAINAALSEGGGVEKLLEGVMRTLDQQKMISYNPDGGVSLLSASGRVMVAIMEDSSITQRALAVYLGVTESNVQKSIKVLTDAGLIEKTKMNSRNVYKVNGEVVLSHPDIARFADGIRNVAVSYFSVSETSDDESPF